jgi:hypothetical protein
MQNPPKLIIYRKTHILVYQYQDHVDKEFQELKYLISVMEKSQQGGTYTSFQAWIFDVDPRGWEVLRLPKHIPTDLLLRTFPHHQITHSATSWESNPIQIFFKSQEYPYKNHNQSKIVNYLKNKNGEEPKLVVAGTAVGKSYCSIRSWVECRSDVLLGTFAQSTHLENFKEELLKFTNIDEKEILVVKNGRSTIQRYLEKPKLFEGIKVILILYRTIGNCIKSSMSGTLSLEPSEFTKFIQLAKVGTHISDEAHLELESLILLALLINVEQTYYLTATPNRTKWMEDRVLNLQIPRDTALYIKAEPRLDIYQVKFNSEPNYNEILKSINYQGYFDVPGYFEYNLKPAKWGYIEELLTYYVGQAFEDNAVSVGIIVGGKLEFLDVLIESMKLAFPEKSIGNFSSRIKAGKLRMAELEKDIIVTTEKSFSGSINPERMTHLLFLAPVSSPVWLTQIAGRLRGLNGNPCIFVDFVDIGFPKLSEQAKRRRSLYKKISLSIHDIVC